MKIKITLLITSLALLIFYFNKDILRLLEDVSLPDQNPELVTYLQGDWTSVEDTNSVLRIKRDSIIEIHDNTIRSVKVLHYLFTGAASKYFAKDSSFVFSSSDKRSLITYDFKLKEVNTNSTDIIWDTLLYVSKLRLDMISHGSTISFNRVK